MTNEPINIAKLLYEAYPHSDLLPIDPDKDCSDLNSLLAAVTGRNIGDSLFRFIVVETVEGGQGTLSGAIGMMMRAREDVQAVLKALQASHTNQEFPDTKPSRTTREVHLLLEELAWECPEMVVPLYLLCEHGKLWIRPDGYGDACSEDGGGFPIAIELYHGHLRLVAFPDINNEEPQIIDLENAKESCQIKPSEEELHRYCAAAEYIVNEGNRIFTGHMNGGLWNGRCMDASRLSRKKNDKVAYDFLIKYGDQYAQNLAEDQKAVWQQIKDSAAAMLNPAS